MTVSDRPLAASPVRLRVLATTDLHMQLTGFDYSADRAMPNTGLTRVARLIKDARQEAETAGAHVLLFDNGDGLQGTPLGDAAAKDPSRRHPLMTAFGHLRYDAIGLGNHDLDFGIDRLAQILTDAPCPVISSNLHLNNPESLPVTDHLVITLPTHGARIGLFSCLPPQTAMWNAKRLRGRGTVSDIISTARQCIDDLRADGCDLVIALAHTGVGSDVRRSGMENAAAILARMEGLDAVIAGHSHDVLPATPGPGTLVLPGSSGSHLGIMDFTLVQTRSGSWTLTDATSEARAVCDAADPVLMGLLQADHADTRTRLDRKIGTTDVPLHSYFAGFAPDRSLALCAHAQAAAVQPFLARSEMIRFPILSAVAPARFGGHGGPWNFTDIPTGDVAERHIIDLCPFDNTLCAALLTGAQVVDWLEMSAGLFAQIRQGDRTTLLDPTFPAHNFDVIFGLEYEIDVSAPPRFDQDGQLCNAKTRRILNPRWHGRALDPTQRFAVAMSSYRAAGGGNIPALRNLVTVDLPELDLRDVLRDHVAGALPPDPLKGAPHPWRFTPIDQAIAIAHTGPGAQDYLSELAHWDLTEAGIGPDGFLRLHLPLSFVPESQVSASLAISAGADYITSREVGAGRHLANPVRSGRKQP